MAETDLPSNSNGKNDCEEDDCNIVTMVDVLKAEETLEENADAVLGPGDDKNCTYDEGYLKRQPLYSCLTCLPADGSSHAGICLACSYHCHGDHDLVELYTKRNFKCDCGNALFKGVACTLITKSGTNELNKYNQNFRGAYCSCHRPYPDPEDTVEDEMIQCVVCEDWYHTRHLGTDIPKEDEYSEMVCSLCMDKLPFLQYYLGYSVNKISKGEKNVSVGDISVEEEDETKNTQQKEAKDSSTLENVETTLENKNQNCDTKGTEAIEETVVNETADSNTQDTDTKQVAKVVDAKENLPVTKVPNEKNTENNVHITELENGSSKKSSSENASTSPSKECGDKDKECLLKNLEKIPRENGASFWTDEFRKMLCRCAECLNVYNECGVPFLIDEEDTVQFYEDKGKGSKRKEGSTQYERGLEALGSLDRVRAMEAILGFNELKSSLNEYLAKFVENKKVVREEDIKEFFSDMKARKRQRLDIPHSCR